MGIELTHEWVNILLISFVGFLLFTEKKYKKLIWLKAFCLLFPLVFALQLTLPSILPGEFNVFDKFGLFAARRSLMYLFILGAVWEICYKDLGKKIKWLWPSFAIIVITGVFTQIQLHEAVGVVTALIGGELGIDIQRYLPYMLPRLALFVPMVLLITEGFKKKHFALISLCALSAGELTSDAQKLIMDDESIYLMQVRLDLIWPTLFSSMMLYSILKVPVLAFLNKSASNLYDNSREKDYVVVDSSGGTSPLDSGKRIDSLRNVLTLESSALAQNPAEVLVAEEIITALAHENRFDSQHLLSSTEMKEYLGFYGVADVDGFVKINNISTHVMPEIPGGSFVRKSDVESALGILAEE